MIAGFGVPIAVAIGLGIAYPYTAMQLMPYGFIFLFLLMIWAGLTVDWTRLTRCGAHLPHIGGGLLLLFLVFPTCQWLLARSLVSDAQFLYGLVFASLCPVAIVAPYFSQLVKADEEFSFLLMVVSMLLCPVVAPYLLHYLLASTLPIQVAPLMKYMLLLVTLPLALSYLISRYLPALRVRLRPHLGLLNTGSLSVMIFILFGTATARLNVQYTSFRDIAILLVLVFIQDFGVLFIARAMLRSRGSAKINNALSISLSMKNVAIAAGILLFYDPRASFPAALGFVAHAFLFSFLGVYARLRHSKMSRSGLRDH